MSEHLGKISFLDTPDVNGSAVITAASLNTALTNVVVPGTEGLTLPNGTTAQRPVTPLVGETRWNTTLAEPEIWSGSAWLPYARVVQSVAGTIAANNSNANITTYTTAPALATGATLWTHVFTPLLTGSSIVIQYTTTISAAAIKNCYTAVYAGSTIIGMTGGGISSANGYGCISMQAVHPSPSTAAITFTAKFANINNTATTYWNQGPAAGSTFGGATVSEYRILEIV